MINNDEFQTIVGWACLGAANLLWVMWLGGWFRFKHWADGWVGTLIFTILSGPVGWLICLIHFVLIGSREKKTPV